MKNDGTTINVYVHLSTGHDAVEWERKWREQSLVGVNDPSPYGYARAAKLGCRVTFSRTAQHHILRKGFRLAAGALTGFDLVHALDNQDAIFASDVVWTHTERQFLAVAWLLKFMARGRRKPKLIGQAVWLYDEWPKLPSYRKWLYRRLIEEVDVLTVHSPVNHHIARSVFPDRRVDLVPFGIPTEQREPVRGVRGFQTGPVRVLCVGNDRHRDWQTLVDALGNQEGVEVLIVSGTAPPLLAAGRPNVRIMRVSSNEELKNLYRQASVLMLPLKPNAHASGITVLEEAVLFGLPVIASDTGGLRSYFDDRCVTYVPPSDASAILSAVRDAVRSPKVLLEKARRAQRRLSAPDMGCEAYVSRHVEISRELLGIVPSEAAVEAA